MGGIGDVIGKGTDRVVHVTGADGPTLPVENGKPVESFEPGEDLLVVFSGADWLPEEVSLGSNDSTGLPFSTGSVGPSAPVT